MRFLTLSRVSHLRIPTHYQVSATDTALTKPSEGLESTTSLASSCIGGLCVDIALRAAPAVAPTRDSRLQSRIDRWQKKYQALRVIDDARKFSWRASVTQTPPT